MKRMYIEHRTVYRYSQPVKFGLHRLVLRPREGHDVTVVKHELALAPGARLFWMQDLFGNQVAIAEIAESADRLEIINRIELDTLRQSEDSAPKLISRSSLVSLPIAYPQTEQPVVNGYIETVYPEDADSIRSWTDACLQKAAPGTASAAVEHLTRSIHQQVTYRRREERGVQSPGNTLAFATGSCRDMATLLMEACRTLGLAARFASGYMHAAASTAGRGSTHAWVEVYFPDSGWRGFDPTVGGPISPKHITLGVSAHPRGVMPVSGIYEGPSGCYLGMEVAVTIREEVRNGAGAHISAIPETS